MKFFVWHILFLLILGFGNPEARKGNESFKKGDYEAAKDWYYQALEKDPENAQVLFNLGNTLFELGEIEESIKVLMQAQSLGEDSEIKSKADYNIGTILSKTEQWKPAVKHLRSALEKNPSDTDAQFNYELALRKVQEEESEQQQNDQNQDQEPPPNPSAYAMAVKEQADALVEQSRYQEAQTLMQEALEVDETVRYYESFMNRIGAVNEIDKKRGSNE